MPPKPLSRKRASDQISICSLHPERAFPGNDTVEFYCQLKQGGLENLIGHKNLGNETFVRHFYTHARHAQNMDIKFRRVHVATFNAAGIRTYYNLPQVEHCRFEELKDDHENFPWAEIEQTLGARWDRQEGSERYIMRGDMNITARIWLIMVRSNIKPSKYLTKISRKAALLLHLLMTNQPVKVEDIIYKSLCKIAYSGRAECALIFPHMISDFYFNAGVPAEDNDAQFRPKKLFEYKSVGRSRGDRDLPSTSGARVRERIADTPPAETSQPSDRELLLQVLANQERILQNQDHFREQLHRINERLDSNPHPMDVDGPPATVRSNPAASGDTLPLNLDEFEDES